VLELKEIVKAYQTANLVQVALNKVSVAFRDNEFVAVLGQSGSGKTTMLNVIGGLDRFQSGDLVIDGISTKDYKARDWDAYRNNRIGRSIGSGKPQADMKTLAQAVLFYYKQVGLWTAAQVKGGSGRKVWRISQNQLRDAEYRRALNNLEVLNSDGMTPFEERLYNPSKLREIKKSVEAIGNVQD